MRTTFAHIIVGIIGQSDSTENRSYVVQSHSKVYSTCLYRLEDAIAKGNTKGMQPYNMIKHIPCSTIILFLQKIVREEIMQSPPRKPFQIICAILPRARMSSKGLSNRVVCLSVGLSVDKEILKQLKYAVIRSEEGTITTFALFWEGHSTDSVIYDLLELQIPSFLISYYSSPARDILAS